LSHQFSEPRSKRAAAIIFERMDDLAQRAVVTSNGPSAIHCVTATAAADAP
jgi:hypothetical protein